jgi:hypothetical protein
VTLVKTGLAETQTGVFEHVIEAFEHLDAPLFEHLLAEIGAENLALVARTQGSFDMGYFAADFPQQDSQQKPASRRLKKKTTG